MKIKLNKIFIDFLFSHIIVLFIPIIIVSIVAMSEYVEILETEIKGSTYEVLNLARHNFDTRLQELDELAYLLSKNKGIQETVFNIKINKEDEALNSLNIIKDIQGFSLPNKFIEDICVFFYRPNYIISTSGKYNPEFFYDLSLSYNSMSLAQWMNEVKKDKNNGKGFFWPSKDVVSMGQNKKVITYISPISIDAKTNEGSIIIPINEEKIKSLFFNGKDNKDSSFFITDSAMNVIFSTTDNIDVKNALVKVNNESPDFFEMKIGDDDYLCLSLMSKTNNWKYISLIPKNMIMSKVNYIKTMILWTLLISVLLGTISAYLLSLREFRPIKSMFDTIRELQLPVKTSHDLGVKNNYQTISHSIKELFHENRNLEIKMKNQLPNIKLNFVSKLITGTYKSLSDISEMTTLFNLKFVSDNFGVISFYVDDYSKFAESSTDNQLDLVKFIICNVTEEIASKGNVAFTYEEGETVSLLINYGAGKDVEVCTKEAFEITRDTMDYIESKCGIIISAGIGNIYSDFSDIGLSCQEAKTALNFRVIKGKNTITLYSKILVNSKNYYYPIDLENTIINLVKLGDYDKASECMETIFVENFKNRKLPIELIYFVSADIVGTILKILNDINIDYNEILGDNVSISKDLLKCSTVDEMLEKTKLFMRDLCKFINDNRESNNVNMKKNILEYVNHKYTDSNLSLVEVADEFKLSSSYLSRFFKDHTGFNFGDYLSRIRLTKAKELLRQSDATINDIAEKVGYNSATSFIRTFKKYESITPGQYKDENVK